MRDPAPPAVPPDADPIDALTHELVASYRADRQAQHLDATFLPSRDKTVRVVELLRRLMFPGFFDAVRVTSDSVAQHTRELLTQTRALLLDQVHQALRYDLNRRGDRAGDDCPDCEARARRVTDDFLAQLPALRGVLVRDIHAAFEGDPAAVSTDETIFCYPGLDAVFIYRVAHALYRLDVPLLPRIMSEYAHNETGIDIHPGARIGESFFIDHGTGVVVGETTIIGDRVKIYQGVTLGALSTKGGQSWRGRKRHPTIEDDVTIYPNATILGGETVIGARCVINGSVFLTHSVPPDHTVRVEHPPPQLRARKPRKTRATG